MKCFISDNSIFIFLENTSECTLKVMLNVEAMINMCIDSRTPFHNSKAAITLTLEIFGPQIRNYIYVTIVYKSNEILILTTNSSSSGYYY